MDSNKEIINYVAHFILAGACNWTGADQSNRIHVHADSESIALQYAQDNRQGSITDKQFLRRFVQPVVHGINRFSSHEGRCRWSPAVAADFDR